MSRKELPAPLVPDPNHPSIRIPDGPNTEPATALQALMEAAPGHEPMESTEERRARFEAVRVCVDMLPEISRRLIEAHVYQGLSFRDIEQAFGVDPDTGKPIVSKSSAQRHLQRALDQLRESLVSSGYAPPSPPSRLD